MPPLQLYQWGGWALFAFLAFSVLVAILRGEFVTGAIYRREVQRGDQLEASGLRLARRTGRLERGLERCRSDLRAATRRKRADATP